MRKIAFVEDEFYHVYNRGVDKRTIFTSTKEYRRFLSYLYLLNTHEQVRPADILEQYAEDAVFSLPRGEPLVALGAYCLMPNHLHMLLTPLVDGGISKYLQRVQTAYTMYFNIKHRRSGALFQGTFKAEHADTDEYLRYLFSYIHLNPAKLKDARWKEHGQESFSALREFVRKYPYSSLGEYLSRKHVLTAPSKFPAYFIDPKDVDDHTDFWLHNRTTREV